MASLKINLPLSDLAKGLRLKEKALILSRATIHGAAGENRTHDPVLTKDVRYHYATAAENAFPNIFYFSSFVKGFLRFCKNSSNQ